MKRIAIFITILLLLILPVSAEDDIHSIYKDQWDSSGIESVWDVISPETQEWLRSFGISDFSSVDLTDQSPQTVMDHLQKMVSAEAVGPLSTLGLLIGILIICALFNGVSPINPSEQSSVFSLIGIIVSYTVIFAPLLSCIKRVIEATNSIQVFMTSFIPVYAGVMIAGGQAASALSYQTILLFALETMTVLIRQIIMPCVVISLAFGFTGGVTPSMKLQSVGNFFNKTSVWIISFVATITVGLLSLQNLVTSAGDTLGSRAIRFSLSTFVPVVGGALGEAFNTVKGCLGLVRNTIGGIGIITTAIIVLPPFIECTLWWIGLSISNVVSDMFGLSSTSVLLRTSISTVKTLIGILSISALLLIIGTTVVTITAAKV